MNKIITISREYGAGGHSIGKGVAEALGIPFYDRDIVRAGRVEGAGASYEYGEILPVRVSGALHYLKIRHGAGEGLGGVKHRT